MRLACVVVLWAGLAPSVARAQLLPLSTPTPGAPPVVAPPAPGREAPFANQDAARSGSSGDPRLAGRLRSRWAVSLPESPSTPVIAGGRLYVGLQTGVEARRVSDGDLLWHQAADRPQVIVADGKVIAEDAYGGAIRAYDAVTGEPVWTAVGDQYGGSGGGVVANGRLYLAYEGSVAAFNVSDGSQVFSTQVYGSGTFPAVSGDRLYLHTGCTVVALDARDGHLLWQTGLGCGSSGGGLAVLYGDRVFASDGFTQIALRAEDGGAVEGPVPVAVDGDVGIVRDYLNGTIAAVSLADGSRLWAAHGGTLLGLPGSVLILRGAQLIQRDLRTGSVQTLLRAPVPSDAGSSGIAAGDGIVAFGFGSTLFALEAHRGGVPAVRLGGGERRDVTAGSRIIVHGSVGSSALVVARVELQTAIGRGAFHTVRSIRVHNDGTFKTSFRPSRNLKLRLVAPGRRASRVRYVFAYPRIHTDVSQRHGLVYARVAVAGAKGVHLRGHLAGLYVGHRGGGLRRLGVTRLNGAGRGTITFRPLTAVPTGDLIFACLAGADRLGLGARSVFSAQCGRPRIDY